jgi:hypothetical protein
MILLSLVSFSAVGALPFLDSFLDKNPLARMGPPNLTNTTNVAIEHMVARAQGNDPKFNPDDPDYLQYFPEAKESHPDIVGDGMVMNYLFINLIAGADTTAIAMRAIISSFCVIAMSCKNSKERSLQLTLTVQLATALPSHCRVSSI